MKRGCEFTLLLAMLCYLLLAAPAAPAATVRGTPVTVMNTAPDGGSIPIQNCENPDRSLYEQEFFLAITPPNTCTHFSFPTPSGKRYNIKYASVICSTPSTTDTFPQTLLTYYRLVVSSHQNTGVAALPSLGKRGQNIFTEGYS